MESFRLGYLSWEEGYEGNEGSGASFEAQGSGFGYEKVGDSEAKGEANGGGAGGGKGGAESGEGVVQAVSLGTEDDDFLGF
jgi:hypothetical protein